MAACLPTVPTPSTILGQFSDTFSFFFAAKTSGGPGPPADPGGHRQRQKKRERICQLPRQKFHKKFRLEFGKTVGQGFGEKIGWNRRKRAPRGGAGGGSRSERARSVSGAGEGLTESRGARSNLSENFGEKSRKFRENYFGGNNAGYFFM